MDETAVLGFAASLGNKIAAVSEEVEELKETLVNPMLEKGRVDTVADLANIEDPQPGWVYLVGLVSDENKSEYMYTASGTWEYLGSHITVDAEPTQGSSNPVSSGGVYSLDIPGRLKSIAAAAAFDPEVTYTTGDYMTLDGELFRCDPINGQALPIGENLLVTYADRLKNSAYGYQDNKYWESYGTASITIHDNMYISGSIPIKQNATYRIYESGWPAQNARYFALAIFTNGTNGQIYARALVYGYNGAAASATVSSSSYQYVSMSMPKDEALAAQYSMYELSAQKFVKTTVADELGTKQDALTFDTTPTADSNNPVTSNGIKLALDAKVNYDDIPTVSKAEYEAIGTEKYTNHKIYFVPDGDVLGANVQIYGWHVDPSESDPEDCITYLEDAVGMTPASMGSTTFSYGSWKNAFFMPRPCMVKSNGKVDYYLDPNDYTKKLDGTASDIADASYDGNAMMEWPLIWWKYEAGEADGEGYFYCSNVKVDNTYNCYCNVNCDNQIVEHFYTAIYNGTGTSKLRSLSGVALTLTNGNGSTTFTQEETRAKANNTTAKTEWYIDVWSDRMLINGLLILMGKSLDSQATFGRGLDSGSQTAKEAYVTGTLNDKGLFWGVTNAGTSGVKVFGMENWYSCVFHRTAGLIGAANDKYAVKMTYGTYDGTTATSYNTDGSGYNLVGTRPATGYTTKASFGVYGYLPKAVGGSTTTYYADYYYNGTGFALVGGYAVGGAYDGVSYVYLSLGAGSAYWGIAASLTLKPLG